MANPWKLSFSILFFTGMLFLLITPVQSQDTYSYSNVQAVDLFEDLQEKSSWRFLYREALLSPHSFSFQSDRDNLLRNLEQSLATKGLTMQVDEQRQQILILRGTQNIQLNQPVTISGQVVDAVTGERLPFATLSWMDNGRLKGQAAGNSGTFRIQLNTPDNNLVVRASYVGYLQEELEINLDSDKTLRDVTIRLTPQSLTGSEIVITGSNYYTQQDSSVTGLIKTDRFSPLGEGNSIRALQILPSVAVTTALNDGLNIRGSSPDGFHVELDGMAIFNQSHLFGLLDSFNDDAIQNSGFFYDVAPAQIHAPSGGTLSLITKTGSLNEFQATAGISNTTAKATLSGPLKKGRSSWLISGRSSYMDQVQWFNNRQLIQWGLDIDRPGSDPVNNGTQVSGLVTPGSSDAYFFDLHGKVYFEGVNGSRTIAGLYFGGDETRQNANRITRNTGGDTRFAEEEVTTDNEWSNFSASLKHQRSLSSSVYSHSTIGISAYETLFSKDDFIYTRVGGTPEAPQISVFTYPLSNQSTMNQVKLDQSFDLFTDFASFTTGFSGIYHRGEYAEVSFDRSGFYRQTESLQVDGYLQADIELKEVAELQAGTRVHYYSNGQFLEWSPRLKATFFPGKTISFGLGYSRNIQFIHRIGFSNVVTADLWVLSNEQQPPSVTDHYSAGMYLRPFDRFYLQIEGYIKNQNRIRLHEINTRSLTNTFSNSPWFFENNGHARGVEFLARKEFPRFAVTQSYTYSITELQNDNINNGERFLAEWDRTHSAATMLEVPVFKGLDLYASWIMASGTPDRFTGTISNNNERLGATYRLDVSASYAAKMGTTDLQAKFSLFNVLNANNDWYREYRLALETDRVVPFLRPVSVDVYDLGFQPSFEVKISF